jgi:hypothetical protein
MKFTFNDSPNTEENNDKNSKSKAVNFIIFILTILCEIVKHNHWTDLADDFESAKWFFELIALLL